MPSSLVFASWLLVLALGVEPSAEQLLNEARAALKEGKFDKAKEMLDPLFSRGRLHFSEFASVCMGHMNLLLAKGEIEGAKSWLQIWEKGYPDHPALPGWRQRLRPTSWFRRPDWSRFAPPRTGR